MNTMYLVAHTLPLSNDPLPNSVAVASVTLDPHFIGGLNIDRELRALAGKLGLFDFEVITADAQWRPGAGKQLPLPFPHGKAPVKRRRR
jgi:hypothetical protein